MRLADFPVLSTTEKKVPMLPTKFLSHVAHIHQLSAEQEAVFQRRFGAHQDYEEIARTLNTSSGACLKRMGQVYKKFGIAGGTRGKENQLRYILDREYDRWQQSSTAPQQQILILYPEGDSEAAIARQWQRELETANQSVTLADRDLRRRKNWWQHLQGELGRSDWVLLLLSQKAAYSELFGEEVQAVKEWYCASGGKKPRLAAVRVGEVALNYELDGYLAQVPQLQWSSPEDTAKIVSQLLRDRLTQGTRTASLSWEAPDGQPLPTAAPELPEGQVDLDSVFYIERPPIESRCFEAIAQPGALIRIKAPRQMGKTSLMARILSMASRMDAMTAHLSFQLAEREVFSSMERFLQWFCASVSYRAHLLNEVEEYWDEFLGSKLNCTAYFEQYLLPQLSAPLVLGLDEVDRLFPYEAIAEDFFGLLRAWHEEGKRKPTWKKLRLVLVCSTEAYLPMDVNQSPFNVGLPIELPEFSFEQVQNLVQRYGLNWESDRVARLMDLVGGHPYLTRVALYRVAREETTLEELIATSPVETSLYNDHLRRHLWNLEKHPELAIAMKQVVNSPEAIRIPGEAAFKLDSMGLVQLKGSRAIPRCGLYRRYFQETLE